MMFNQILPDYVEGLVVVTNMNKLTAGHLNVYIKKYIYQQLSNILKYIYFKNDIALLSALQYKAGDKEGLPSM